eukprot:SAG31_NODE_5348_length_2593_cov_2.070970_2_plen_63_part_00
MHALHPLQTLAKFDGQAALGADSMTEAVGLEQKVELAPLPKHRLYEQVLHAAGIELQFATFA